VKDVAAGQPELALEVGGRVNFEARLTIHVARDDLRERFRQNGIQRSDDSPEGFVSAPPLPFP
jgi:hypothetical protein